MTFISFQIMDDEKTLSDCGLNSNVAKAQSPAEIGLAFKVGDKLQDLLLIRKWRAVTVKFSKNRKSWDLIGENGQILATYLGYLVENLPNLATLLSGGRIMGGTGENSLLQPARTSRCHEARPRGLSRRNGQRLRKTKVTHIDHSKFVVVSMNHQIIDHSVTSKWSRFSNGPFWVRLIIYHRVWRLAYNRTGLKWRLLVSTF